MIIFTGIFLVLLIKMIGKKKERKDNIFFLLLSFILGFNYLMGTDWRVYQEHYNNINVNNYLKNSFEFGYNIYTLLIKYMFRSNYELFIGMTIFICVYILLINIKKRAENYYFAIAMYLPLYLINSSLEPVIRQMIGTTILICGLKYIDKKNFLKYLITVLIAAQFHTSMYIGLSFYFLDKIKISIYKLFFITIMLFLMIENLNALLSIQNDFTTILKFKKFQEYLLSERYGTKSITLRTIFMFILNGGYIYIIFNSYKESLYKKNYILNCSIIYCLICIFNYKLGILYRIKELFSFFFIISLASIEKTKFYKKKYLDKKSAKIIMIIILLFQLLLFYKAMLGNDLNVFRYGNYKNYFIELIKDDFYKNKEEKEKKYMEKIKEFLDENNKEMKEKVSK